MSESSQRGQSAEKMSAAKTRNRSGFDGQTPTNFLFYIVPRKETYRYK